MSEYQSDMLISPAKTDKYDHNRRAGNPISDTVGRLANASVADDDQLDVIEYLALLRNGGDRDNFQSP